MSNERERMLALIELTKLEISHGYGPFGAAIYKEGELVAQAFNSVTLKCDPTAHAEVNAIRTACAKLHSFKLDGCELYTTCEPCPMCFGAIYWARLDYVYFAATSYDADAAGFSDNHILNELTDPLLSDFPGSIEFESIGRIPALEIFSTWQSYSTKILY